MAVTKIEATLKDGERALRTVEVEYDFGSDVQDAIRKFGADVVFAGFKKSEVIDVQSLIRRTLKSEASDEKGKLLARPDWAAAEKVVKEKVKAYKPTIGRSADPEKAAARLAGSMQKMFGNLSEREQRALFAEMMAARPAKPGLVKAGAMAAGNKPAARKAAARQ